MCWVAVYHYDLAQQSVMVKADTQIQKYMSRENLIRVEMQALVCLMEALWHIVDNFSTVWPREEQTSSILTSYSFLDQT